MSFLYWLESIRNPILDAIMLLVTMIGEETLFLGIALCIFWCISKHQGYRFLVVGFGGIMINQVLKLLFRIPRPWVQDPEFHPVEGAIEEATGYSFPSGHTQNVTDTFGFIARTAKYTWLRILSIVIIILVAFSRMYLGVHTPLDVCVSLGVGALLILLVYPLLERITATDRGYWMVYGGMILCAIGFVLFTELFPFPADIDPHNLTSGRKNAYTMLGCALALTAVYAIDSRKTRFDTAAPLWGQIGKLAVGLGLTVGLKAALKPLTVLMFGGDVAESALRYFLVVIFAGALWPLTFPLWAKVGRKKDKA